MTRVRITLLLSLGLSIFTLARPGFGQIRERNALEIGNHVISLGAPVDGVISDLQRDYTVTVGAKSPLRSWLVSTGDKFTMPFGAVYAKGDRVVGIDHLVLGREINSSQDIFDALFDASSKLAAREHTACVVTTSTAYEAAAAGLSKAAIHLSCGAYRVRLQRNEFKSLKGEALTSYMVWEELGAND